MPSKFAPRRSYPHGVRHLQIAEHEFDDGPPAPFDIGGGCHLPLEDHAQTVLVGEIHNAKCADRNVEVDRLDILPELSAALAALENAGDDIGQRGLEHLELLRFAPV